MSTEKLTRKEMREPDSFVKVTGAYWDKVVQHQKVITIGLVAAFAVFIAVALIVRSTQSKSENAGAALARALELARRGVEGSLDTMADPEAPKFKSQQEKHEEIAKALETLRAEYPGTDASRTAAVYLADAQYNLGKLDEAAKNYRDFLDATKAGDPLRVVAYEGLGYVYESKKDWDKALDAFDGMVREAQGDPAKALAAFHRARVLELSGKKQQAAEAFQKLKDEYKEASAAREASERLALLAAQGVMPTPKPPAEEPAKIEPGKQP